jgi:hypothetical protein
MEVKKMIYMLFGNEVVAKATKMDYLKYDPYYQYIEVTESWQDKSKPVEYLRSIGRNVEPLMGELAGKGKVKCL